MKTLTRAITLSIVPADGTKTPVIWQALHASWNACQRAANAALREWFTLDSGVMCDVAGRKNGSVIHPKYRLAKIDKSLQTRPYAAARGVSPELPAGSTSDICQRVRAMYFKGRFNSQIRMNQSGISFARPIPLPIRMADWQLHTIKNGNRTDYHATFGLLDMRGKDRPTFALVIRTKRDADLLTKIVSGEYKRRTLEIMPAGWDRKGPIRAKIVYSMPAPESMTDGGTRNVPQVMKIRTGAPSLIESTTNGNSRPFRWNLRWLRSRIIAYERGRQMRAEDRKYERRMPKHRRQVLNRDGGRARDKHLDRVKTEIQKIAFQIVARAVRMRCDVIEYDDTDRSWLEKFPWNKLKLEINRAAENRGITVCNPGGSPVGSGHCMADEPHGPLDAVAEGAKPCSETVSERKDGAM